MLTDEKERDLALAQCFRQSDYKRTWKTCKFIQEVRESRREAFRRKSRAYYNRNFNNSESLFTARIFTWRETFSLSLPSPPRIFRHGTSQYRVVTPTSISFLISPRTIQNPWPRPVFHNRVIQPLFDIFHDSVTIRKRKPIR